MSEEDLGSSLKDRWSLESGRVTKSGTGCPAAVNVSRQRQLGEAAIRIALVEGLLGLHGSVPGASLGVVRHSVDLNSRGEHQLRVDERQGRHACIHTHATLNPPVARDAIQP